MVRLASEGSSRKSPGFWSRLTDEELLNCNFYQYDPTKLEGLLQTVPDTDEVPEVEFSYDTRNTEIGQIMCIHCHKHKPNHNRGFVLRFSDGRRMLFGKDCGATVYGAEFVHNRREFEAATKRADLLQKYRRLHQAKGEAIRLLEQVEAHPAWDELVNARRNFNRAFPDIVQELCEAATYRSGELLTEQKVRDPYKEAEYESKTGRSVQMYKTVPAVIHRLSGADFFLNKPSAKQSVVALSTRARNALWAMELSAPPKNGEIEQLITALGRIVDDLQGQAALLDDLRAAFSPENIAGIGLWLEAAMRGTMRIKDGTVIRCNRNGDVRLFWPSETAEVQRRAEMPLPAQFPSPTALIADIKAHVTT